MATDLVVNKGVKGGYVTTIWSAGGYLPLNSSVAARSANSAGEVVNEMLISDVYYGIGGANNVQFTIKRGTDTVLVLSGPGSGRFDFQAAGLTIESGSESTANLVVTRSGTGPATVVIKLHKRSSFTSSY
jgi:hypothetical protein